ncbi:MAG TPA: histidine triad nucleotide-binding protein [Pseudomonadales bacterium]|nr:histidine triad nucleotide-binding protein [Pseudomonadales bacterium]
MSDTIFGKILAGDIPAPKVYEDDHCIVINDIQPQAPVHMLVIPRKPIPRLVDATPEDQALLGHLMLVARQVAQAQGIGEGFRLVVNNGQGGGQTVFHLHLHVMGGTTMAEGTMI